MPPEPTRLAPVSQQPETVSVVIPSWTGKVARVVASVEAQTYKDLRIEVVKGVSPAARARNIGVGRTSGRLILFVDDDAYLGHERVVERLVEALEGDETIGVVGPSMLVPPDANSFQRTLAGQAPRWEFPVQEEDLESNPPLDHYGHTGITTTCCMLRRELFEAMGGFDETLPTGPEDTDFFFRVRREGYRFVVPRQCWVYHYPPRELRVMFRKYFAYGVGHALEAWRNPERNAHVVPLNRWYGKVAVALSPFLLVPSIFANVYQEPSPHVAIGPRPLKALSTYAALYGYAWEWRKLTAGKAGASAS